MMRQLRHVNIDAAATPPQVPFSHAVADGHYAFLAGRLAADAIDREVKSTNIEEKHARDRRLAREEFEV